MIRDPDKKAMAISSLCESLLTDTSPVVRCSAAEALGKICSEDAIPALAQALKDLDYNVRKQAAEAIGKIGGIEVSGDRIDRIVNTGGGPYYESINTEGGTYIQGDYVNLNQDLTQAASQIQDLLDRLQQQGMTVDAACDRVANDMADRAQNDPTMKAKLIKWGQSLGNATASDVIKGIVKLAIRSAGLPLP